ncbi:MAG: c-type cytochrome [Myxococcota bacterium]
MGAKITTGVALFLCMAFVLFMAGSARADAATGKQVFSTYCVACHGPSGAGDGPAAAALDPKPRDLTTGEFKYGSTDEDLFKFISTGKGPMPPWDSLPEADRRAVIKYIRSLKK